MKVRDRGEVYDRLYALAEKLLRRASACSTCPIACKKSEIPLFVLSLKSKSDCCGECPFLGPQGCTVKALGCKLWLCQEERLVDVKLTRRLDRLAEIASHYKINSARADKALSLRYGGKGLWFVYEKWTGPSWQRKYC